MKAYSFSRAGILAMPLPEKNNQVLYPDPETRFHYVRVTSNGARSFVVDRNTPRGRIRITLGQAGTDALTAEQARKSALIVLGLIEQGFTAGQIKDRLARVDERVPEGAVTLGQVFEEYLQDRTGKLSERTVSDYRRLMDSHLNDWRHKPVETIDEAAVRAKFHSIKSPSRANYTMRLLRALLNLGKSINSDTGTPVVSINPVQILSNRKLWHREEPKREVIDLAALPAWWRAVEKL
ncbi:MAG: Arm DNA-binding domain-containing protein, partial [Burkholderiales bacterium]|nr:Arm DNA-binding domain-containing protein [Burkholderiales bacterium]